jgi:hypothetical protein
MEMTIDINLLPEETLRVVMAIAADRDVSPNQVALEMLNHAARNAERKPAA